MSNDIEDDLSDYFELIERVMTGGQGYPASYDCSAVRIRSTGAKRDVIPTAMLPRRLRLIDRAMIELQHQEPLVYKALKTRHFCRLPAGEKALSMKVHKRQYHQLVREGMLYLSGAYAVGDNTLLRVEMS